MSLASRLVALFATNLLIAEYLVVAGGGGGGTAVEGSLGRGGGGGAGGLRTGYGLFNFDSYTVTVGAGGAADTSGGNSSLESFASCTGGGKGGSPVGDGANGGSGGGGSNADAGTTNGGTGVVGEGHDGDGGNGILGFGGGGGAGAAATDFNGGAGVASSISGSSVTYAKGGTGGANELPAVNPGDGGSGGNGPGSGIATSGANGIVIIRYPGSARGTGGTIATSGGFTTHTFTSSGTFTRTI